MLMTEVHILLNIFLSVIHCEMIYFEIRAFERR